jgi:hypothetical protein
MQVTNSLSSLFGSSGANAAQAMSNLVINKTSNAASSSSSSDSSSGTDSSSNDSQAVKDFLAYMKEPVGQRMEEAWLKAHNLTADDLKSMPAAQRDAIEKQMANDIKSEMQQKAQQQAQAKTTAQASSAASLATLLSNSL